MLPPTRGSAALIPSQAFASACDHSGCYVSVAVNTKQSLAVHLVLTGRCECEACTVVWAVDKGVREHHVLVLLRGVLQSSWHEGCCN